MNIHHLPGRGYDSNIFLVKGDDPFLVDAGTGSNHSAVLAWTRELMGNEAAEQLESLRNIAQIL